MSTLPRFARFGHLPLLLWSLIFVACAGEQAPPDVVARSIYGDTTLDELETYILSLPERRRQPAEGQPLGEWRREVLEEMLVTRRLGEEAREAKLLGTEDGQAFVNGRWYPLLEGTVRDRRVAERVRVSDEDLRRYYDEHPEEFGHGPQIRVRHIFKRATREASAEERAAVRREIDELHRQLEGGASFIELARTQSDSETANLDGLIGRLDPGALGPEVDRILWALGEGEISDVVSTPVGFHIFRVDNHLEPFKMEFSEARTRLRRRFERQAAEATLDAYFDELLQASGALFDPDGLAGDGDTVLFSLGDVELTREEFFDRLMVLGFHEQRVVSLRQHLEDVVTQELYRWEADRSGLDEEPGLAAQRERIEQTALVELAYRSRRQAHLEELHDSVLEPYYEENAARFRSPYLIRLSLLVREFEGDEGREWFELYEELERVAAGIRAGELDFATEASRWSQDISASRGGDTGWIRPGTFGDWAGPRAAKAVRELTVGEVSAPILIEFYDENQMLYERHGYALVRIDEVRDPADRSFDDVRDVVAEQFVANGSEELQRKIARQVLEEIGTRIFDEHL